MEETYGPQRGHETLCPVPEREPATPAHAPADDDPVLLDRRFGSAEITAVRHEVQARLTAVGLTGDRLHALVLAVNEVITNVVLHAGGHGRLVLRRDDDGDSVWCTVTDSGPGIPERYLASAEVPETLEVGGRGVWLAYQLCDEVTVATGPIGTTIALRMDLPTR